MERSSQKLTATKNYDLFSYAGGNRDVNIKKHRNLLDSMKQYGYIPAYPLHCIRENSKLIIKDGQHRLAIAKLLGLPVWYIVCDDDADVALLSNAQTKWTINDYASRFISSGNEHYIRARQFADANNIPLSTAASILAGRGNHSGTLQKFRDGTFEISADGDAARIASLYRQLGEINPAAKGTFLIAALSLSCRVKIFEDERLIRLARRCPELIMSFGSRDRYLDAIEQIYNFGQRERFPLKHHALESTRRRSRRPATNN